MKPICKGEHCLFYRYLHFVFTPRLITKYVNFDSDTMSGSIYLNKSGEWEGKPFTAIYCSPMWETEVETVTFEFHGDDGYIGSKTVPFPLNGWTMNVEKDVDRFAKMVSDFIKDNDLLVI